MVQATRTSSNLLEPHHYKDSKVCRVLSHEVGVVRLYRTFSIYIVTGETRCAGCLCTSSGWFKQLEPLSLQGPPPTEWAVQGQLKPWFKHIEPHRTFSKHITTEIASGSNTSNIHSLICLHGTKEKLKGTKIHQKSCGIRSSGRRGSVRVHAA